MRSEEEIRERIKSIKEHLEYSLSRNFGLKGMLEALEWVLDSSK